MSKIALILVSGNAEIVGKVVEETAEYVTLEEPLVLRPVQKGPDQYVLSFFQHSMANPQGTHKFFYSSMVSRSIEVPEPLEKQYLKETSSIILANALDAFEKLGS